VRIAQLTYNVQNRIASGCWEDDDQGLSKFYGRNAVAEMNKVGILIDLSHSTERTCFDAIEYSSRPVAITHANPSEFVGTDIELNRRNKSTPLIKRLVERGGVIGLSMYPKIMRGGSDCTLDTFLDMIAWTVDLVGSDAVAFGSDFYTGWPESQLMWWRAGRWSRESAVPIRGFSKWPFWFQSPADYPAIIEAMEIRKIAGGNWLRLFRETFEPLR
jgi:microsomal dipeptidase-like Zn-dependent dipeptidase